MQPPPTRSVHMLNENAIFTKFIHDAAAARSRPSPALARTASLRQPRCNCMQLAAARRTEIAVFRRVGHVEMKAPVQDRWVKSAIRC